MGDYTERLIFGFDGSKNKNGRIYRFSERGKAEIRECIDNLRRAIEKSPIVTTRFDARSSDEKDRGTSIGIGSGNGPTVSSFHDASRRLISTA